MNEDRKPHDEDLPFDDEFVRGDDERDTDPRDEFLDEVDGEDPLTEPPPRAAGRDHADGPGHDGADAASDEDDDDLFADDEFVIEFDDAEFDETEADDAEFDAAVFGTDASEAGAGFDDAELGAAVAEAAGLEADAIATAAASTTRRELHDLFSADAPVAGEADDETDALFTGHGTAGDEHRFEGVRERPEFVEDHAGWYGDDIELADMVGESAATQDDSPDGSFDYEEGIDDDPFAIDDVEIESLDDGAETVPEPELEAAGAVGSTDESAAADGDADDGFDALESFDDDLELGAAEETWEASEPSLADAESAELDVEPSAAGDDAWAPLGAGESWVMGEQPAAVDGFDTSEDDAEAVTALFGGGRNDTFGSGEIDAGADAGSEGLDLRDDLEPAEELEPEEYVDPIYGDVGAGIDAVTEEDEDGEEVGLVDDGYDYDDDASELEESYVDTSPQTARVVGGGRGRRFTLLRVAAALAVTVGIGGGAVVALRPEWVGLDTAPESVHRVEVARPRIDLALAAPVPDGLEAGTDPEQPGDTPPDVVIPPVVGMPPGDTPPGDVPPVEVPPDVVPVPPVEPTDPTPPPRDPIVQVEPRDPVQLPVVPADQPDAMPRFVFEPLEFGEGLEVRSTVDVDEVAGVRDILPGTRAFAQMRNEEIFIGVVKRVEAAFVTLDLQPGEVSLARAELSVLSPLATADGSEFTAAEHGFVRLPSEARLWGRILRNTTTDNVILRTEDARITIPARDVMQVSGSSKSGTTLVDDDDRWLDRMAREKLRGVGTPARRPGDPATPPSGGR